MALPPEMLREEADELLIGKPQQRIAKEKWLIHQIAREVRLSEPVRHQSRQYDSDL